MKDLAGKMRCEICSEEDNIVMPYRLKPTIKGMQNKCKHVFCYFVTDHWSLPTRYYRYSNLFHKECSPLTW